MPNILPVSDLRNYNEVLKNCQVGEPVFLTKNGRGRFVVMDIEDYERDKAEKKLLEKLQEAEAAVKAAYEYQGPVYLRMGRLAVPVFHEDGFKFKIGKGEIMREGTDIAIIANGLMTYEAIKAGEALEAMGIHARIVNMSTIKPLDEELVVEAAKACGKVITCEEHSIIGGLGEAVCSYLAETCPVPVKRIGVNDKFGCSGTAAEVLKAYGLSAEHIVEVTKVFLNR